MTSTARNLFLGALAVILVVGVALIVLSQRPATPTSSNGETKTVKFTANGEEQTLTLVKVPGDPASGARFVTGKADAPVTMVEFADYQCPTCGLYANQIEAQFKAEFVDTGKVKLVFRDFPLPIHQNAPRAASAAGCALEQNRWSQFHDFLFRAQPQWSSSGDDVFQTQLVDFAKQLGMDDAAFKTCLEADKFKTAIETDMAAGNAVNLTGTPTFVVNGYRVDSDRLFPIEGFRAVLASFGVQ
jgi:protein-disulfide isomerase